MLIAHPFISKMELPKEELKLMKTFIVDSFTNQPFKGNPAGVCIVDQELSEKLMLSIARELNFSETAFIQQLDTEDRYSIRFFSPKMEIPLCGHATLASAKVLFKKEGLEEIHFINIQNLDLHITKETNQIVMKFPVYNTKPADASRSLLDALGIDQIINSEYNKETNILLIEISDTELLENLEPDFEALIRSHDSINGVLVTAPAGSDNYDFHSRYFWPWSGTNEDPVTGGTHTFLAKYWSERLSKSKMKSYQSSKRSGFMEVELLDDSNMFIKSQAVIIFEGKLKVKSNG